MDSNPTPPPHAPVPDLMTAQLRRLSDDFERSELARAADRAGERRPESR